MENKKFDITSTALEKGVDIAKNFLDKLIIPAVEETGLLLKDHVTMWKFKRQVGMLNKAKIICEKNKISPKAISLKLLVPLLDYSGLEEDETLHDKWAILLSNMVDSEQNVENHVFPYILSQISKNEFFVLEKIYDDKIARVNRLTKELEEFIAQRPEKEKEYEAELKEINEKIENKRKEDSERAIFGGVWELQKERRVIDSKLSHLKYYESSIKYSIRKPEIFPYGSLEEFEFSNIIRLGLAKEEKEFYANPQTLEIPNDREYDRSYTNIDLDIDVESTVEIILTQLGELFINACKEKQQNNH